MGAGSFGEVRVANFSSGVRGGALDPKPTPGYISWVV